jgi:hypothetical protein
MRKQQLEMEECSFQPSILHKSKSNRSFTQFYQDQLAMQERALMRSRSLVNQLTEREQQEFESF